MGEQTDQNDGANFNLANLRGTKRPHDAEQFFSGNTRSTVSRMPQQ